jgi:hypothetical protein
VRVAELTRLAYICSGPCIYGILRSRSIKSSLLAPRSWLTAWIVLWIVIGTLTRCIRVIRIKGLSLDANGSLRLVLMTSGVVHRLAALVGDAKRVCRREVELKLRPFDCESYGLYQLVMFFLRCLVERFGESSGRDSIGHRTVTT